MSGGDHLLIYLRGFDIAIVKEIHWRDFVEQMQAQGRHVKVVMQFYGGTVAKGPPNSAGFLKQSRKTASLLYLASDVLCA